MSLDQYVNDGLFAPRKIAETLRTRSMLACTPDRGDPLRPDRRCGAAVATDVTNGDKGTLRV